MKTLVLSFLMLAGSASFAQNGIRQFATSNVVLHPDHAQPTATVQIEVDYNQKTARLTITDRFVDCRPNEICTQMPRPVEVLDRNLKITKVKTDSCNIHHIEARQDERFVDGALHVLTLQDGSQDTCMYIRAPDYKATYTTHYFDRIQMKEVTATSTMEVMSSPFTPPTPAISFKKGEFSEGFYDGTVARSGSLDFNDEFINMNIYMVIECKQGRPCVKMIPSPIRAHLPVIKVERTNCGITYTARSATPGDVTVEEIRLTDYRTSVCEIGYPSDLIAEYSEVMKYKKGDVVKKAVLYFNAPQLF